MEQSFNGKFRWNATMKTKTIVIAKEFTETPAGRYVTDGSYSGERFRDDILLPALLNNDLVTINLDGTLGYGSSFLEEAFGGLIREKDMTLSDIKAKLQITSSRTLYPNRIWKYLENAQERKNKRR